MAHKMVIHAGNYKKGSVGALEHHNLRENETYSNKDIDRDRTKENIVLKHPKNSQYQDAKEIIEKKAVNQVRSTSIWQSEFIISSDQEFFKGLPREEQNRFFQESYNYLAKEFGEQNITCSAVHYDEMTPHMHFDFVPMTKENKLSRKEVMTRERLIRIQEELPRYLKEKGFDVERGRKMTELAPKDRPKHKDHKEWKKELYEADRVLERREKQQRNYQKKLDSQEEEQTEQKLKFDTKQKEFDKQVARLEKSMKDLKELPKADKSLTGKMQLPEPDYQKLYIAAQYGLAAYHLQEEIKKKNKQLMDICLELKEKNSDLKRKLPTVKEKLHQNEQLAKAARLEKENIVMKDALQELQKMKLPEKSAKVVIKHAMEMLKEAVQEEEFSR